MGRVKDYAVDLADELIDAAVQKVKKGYDRSKAIKDLLNDPAVRTFFDEVDIDQIMDFELTEKNFLQLPVVQSSYFRCFPCGAGFKPLQYKLHIMTKHKLGNKPFQMFL